jgi:histidine triad (HIT) family protein
MTSIFTKIINGEIPCHKVYEDDKTLAFLTINPIHPGHALVIPKTEVDHLWDLSDDDYQAVMTTVKKVGHRMREVLKPNRVGVHVAGTEVPHAHVHVFPFQEDADFWDKPQSGDPDHAALAEMAKKLAF